MRPVRYAEVKEIVIMFGYNVARHPVLNLPMICLWSELDRFRSAEVRLVPEYGSDICSFIVDGIEYLHQGFSDVAGMKFFGIPMMYPFPNRIDGCKVEFNGETYRLPDTDNGRTLHGLISAAPFTFETPVLTDESISIKTSLTIDPEHPLYAVFPIANRLELTTTLESGSLTIQAKIMNLDSTKRLPFGFGIHPYFNALGMKKDILIRVPAKGYMPANWLIPTGKIVSMEEGPADLRGLTPLDKLDLDDLWWGMEPLKPMEIYYESIKRKVSIFASDIFTHAVTYTPAAQGFFCLENQTNATDAVRLYQDGHQDAAHLIILDPGESIAGKIRIQVEALRE